MNVLTILGVTEILCGFKLVLEGKTGKEITESSRLEFLEKVSANNFSLSDAEDNTTSLLNTGGTAELPLLRTLLAICQKSLEPSFREVMDSYFISICKFGSFKNPYAMITSLSELYFRIRRFILLIETKKVISLKCGSISMRDIYINSNLNPLTKFIRSSRSTEFKDILPWNISLMITKTVSISTRIVISFMMKRGIPL